MGKQDFFVMKCFRYLGSMANEFFVT